MTETRLDLAADQLPRLPAMDLTIISYSLYLTISVPLTVWVAQTLFRNGAPFLRACFPGDDEIAHSINHLLRVGFYLLNLGFIALHLRQLGEVASGREVFETVAAKTGVVLLVLGAMHFFNLWLFQKLRRSARLRQRLHLPPVNPTFVATEPA